MKILVFNGSPKVERSNTLQLTKAFCEGIAQAELTKAFCEEIAQAEQTQIEVVPIYQLKIQDCRGCFRCWSATPGVCCLKDDVEAIIGKVLEADLVIWSFPLYYFGLPSRCKALMDRLLPMYLPFMSKGARNGGHPSRYDLSGKRFAVISTCGFYTSQCNYDAVTAQFDRLYGKDGYTALYCGEGELFRVPELRKRTQEYLDIVRRAGQEFVSGSITPSTREELAQLLVPREAFEEMADADWGVQALQSGGKTAASVEVSLQFTRQMAALYNKAAWNGKDRVVEFHYTDVGKTYQILLLKEGHRVLTEDFLPYTTRIETPLFVWREIAEGKRDGRQAMIEHQYTIQGDFDLMLHWDEIFGVGNQPSLSPTPAKKTNMLLFLAPWITLWALLALHPVWGGAAGILTAAALPLAFLKWKPTVFEGITALAAAIIGLLALFGCSVTWLLPLSYLLFGLLWLGTVFCRLPLSAYYSVNSYQGEKEWENPLFLRTNRILTACWGILYLVTPVWTYFLLQTSFAPWTGAVNSIFPALLGLFTAWFQKWYPAHYAARGIRS